MADTLQRVHSTLAQMQKNLECSICLELLRDPVLTKCDHHFCNSCILALLQSKRRSSAPCPLCKEPVTKRGLIKHESLKKIVDAYRSIITAVEDDTGQICTPPRGPIRLSQPEPASQRPRQPTKKAGKRSNVRRGRKKALPAIPIHLDPDVEEGMAKEVGNTTNYNVNVRSAFPSSKETTKDSGASDALINPDNNEDSSNKVIRSEVINGPDILDALAEESLGHTKSDHGQQNQKENLGFNRTLTEKPVTANNNPSPSDPYEFIASQKTPKKVKKRATKGTKKKKPWEYSFKKISRKKKKNVENRENQTRDDWQSDDDEEDSSLVHREDVDDQEEGHGEQSRVDDGGNFKERQEASDRIREEVAKGKIAENGVCDENENGGNRGERGNMPTIEESDDGKSHKPNQRIESSDDEFVEDFDFGDQNGNEDEEHQPDAVPSEKGTEGRRGERRKSASKALEAIKDQHPSQSSGEVAEDSRGQSLSDFTPFGRAGDNRLPLFEEPQESRPLRRIKEPLNVRQRPYYNPSNADQEEVPLSQPPVLNRNHGDKLFARTYGKAKMKSPPPVSKGVESRLDLEGDLPDVMSIDDDDEESDRDEGGSRRGDSQEVSLRDVGLPEIGDEMAVHEEDGGDTRIGDMQDAGENDVPLLDVVEDREGELVAPERQMAPHENDAIMGSDEENVVDLTLDEDDEEKLEENECDPRAGGRQGVVVGPTDGGRKENQLRTVEKCKSGAAEDGRATVRDGDGIPCATSLEEAVQRLAEEDGTTLENLKRKLTLKEKMRNKAGLMVSSDESDDKVSRNQQEESDWELAMKLAEELGSVPPGLEIRSLRGRKEAEEESKDRGKKGRRAKQLTIENGPEPGEETRRVRRTRGRGGLRTVERDQEETVAIDSFKDNSGGVAGETGDIDGRDETVESRGITRTSACGGHNAACDNDMNSRRTRAKINERMHGETILADDVIDEMEDSRRTKGRKANGKERGNNEREESRESVERSRNVRGSRVTGRARKDEQEIEDHLMNNASDSGTRGKRTQRKKRSEAGQDVTGDDPSKAEIAARDENPSRGICQGNVSNDALVNDNDGNVRNVDSSSDGGKRTRSSGRKSKADDDAGEMTRKTRATENAPAEDGGRSGESVGATGYDKTEEAVPRGNGTPDDMVRCVPETPYIGNISVECGLDPSEVGESSQKTDKEEIVDQDKVKGDEDRSRMSGRGRRKGDKCRISDEVQPANKVEHPDSGEKVATEPKPDGERVMEASINREEESIKGGERLSGKLKLTKKNEDITPNAAVVPSDDEFDRDEGKNGDGQTAKRATGGNEDVEPPECSEATQRTLRKSSRLSKEKSSSSRRKMVDEASSKMGESVSKGQKENLSQEQEQNKLNRRSQSKDVTEDAMDSCKIVCETLTGASGVDDGAPEEDVEDGKAERKSSEELQLAADIRKGEEVKKSRLGEARDDMLAVGDEGGVDGKDATGLDDGEEAGRNRGRTGSADKRRMGRLRGQKGREGKPTGSSRSQSRTRSSDARSNFPEIVSEIISDDEFCHEDGKKSDLLHQEGEVASSGEILHGQNNPGLGRPTRSSKLQEGGKAPEPQEEVSNGSKKGSVGENDIICVGDDDREAVSYGNENEKMRLSKILSPGNKKLGKLSRSPRGARGSNDSRKTREHFSSGEDGMHKEDQERPTGSLAGKRRSSRLSKSQERSDSADDQKGMNNRETPRPRSVGRANLEVALFDEEVQDNYEHGMKDELAQRNKSTQKTFSFGRRGAPSGSSTESIQIDDSNPTYAETDAVEATDRKTLGRRDIQRTTSTEENLKIKRRQKHPERKSGTDESAGKPTRSLRSRGKREEDRETDVKVPEKGTATEYCMQGPEETRLELSRDSLTNNLILQNGSDENGSNTEGNIRQPLAKEHIRVVDGMRKDHGKRHLEAREDTEGGQPSKGRENSEIDELVLRSLEEGFKRGLDGPNAEECNEHSPDIFTMHLDREGSSVATVGTGETVGRGVAKESKLSLKTGKKKKKRKTFAFGNDVQLEDSDGKKDTSEVREEMAPNEVEVLSNSCGKNHQREEEGGKFAGSAEEGESEVFQPTGASNTSEPFVPATMGASESLGEKGGPLLPGHRLRRLDKEGMYKDEGEELAGPAEEGRSTDAEMLQATGESGISEHFIPATMGASESLGDKEGSALPGHRPRRLGRKAKQPNEMLEGSKVKGMSDDLQKSDGPTVTSGTSRKGRGKRMPADPSETLEKPHKRYRQHSQRDEASENDDDDECSMIPPSQPAARFEGRRRKKVSVDEMGEDSSEKVRQEDGISKEEVALSMVETFKRLGQEEQRSSAASPKKLAEGGSMSLGTPSISLLQDVEIADDETNIGSEEPRGKSLEMGEEEVENDCQSLQRDGRAGTNVIPNGAEAGTGGRKRRECETATSSSFNKNAADEEIEISDDDGGDNKEETRKRKGKKTGEVTAKKRMKKSKNQIQEVRADASEVGGAEEDEDAEEGGARQKVIKDGGLEIGARGDDADDSGREEAGGEEGDEDGDVRGKVEENDECPGIVEGKNGADSEGEAVVVDEMDRDAEIDGADKNDRDRKLDDVYDAECGEDPLFDDDCVSQSSMNSRHDLTSASSVLSSQSDLMNSQQEENAKETLKKMKQEIAEMERALAEEAGLEGARATTVDDSSDESDLEDVGLVLTGRSADKAGTKSEKDGRIGRIRRLSIDKGEGFSDRGLENDMKKNKDVVDVEELGTEEVVGSWLEGGKYRYSREESSKKAKRRNRTELDVDDSDHHAETDQEMKVGRKKSVEEDGKIMPGRMDAGNNGRKDEDDGETIVESGDDDDGAGIIHESDSKKSLSPVRKSGGHSVNGESEVSPTRIGMDGGVSAATRSNSGGPRSSDKREKTDKDKSPSGSGREGRSVGSADSDAVSNGSSSRKRSGYRRGRSSLTKFGNFQNVDNIEDEEVAENVKKNVSEMAAAEESLNSIMKTLAAQRRKDELAEEKLDSQKQPSKSASGVERDSCTPLMLEVGVSPSSPRSPSPPPAISQRTLLQRVSPLEEEIAEVRKVERIAEGGVRDVKSRLPPEEEIGGVETTEKSTGGTVSNRISAGSQKKRRRVVVEESSSEDEDGGSANPTKVPKLDSLESKDMQGESTVSPGRVVPRENGNTDEQQVRSDASVAKGPAKVVEPSEKSADGEKGRGIPRDQTRNPSSESSSRDGHRRKKPRKGEAMSLITTGLNKQKLKLVDQLCRKAGCRFSSAFTPDTTHVIVNADEDLTCERTLKYFQGIAARRWVISYHWVQDSLSASRLLPQEKYEIRGDTVNGRNHCGPRRARLWKGPSLLSHYGFYCLEPYTGLTKDQLHGLLSMCGGTVVDRPSNLPQGRENLIIAQADASVTPPDYNALYQKFGIPVISREWVLDSIAVYTSQPINDYLLCDVTCDADQMDELDSGDEF